MSDRHSHSEHVSRLVLHLRHHAVGRARALRAQQLTQALGFSDRYLRALAHAANDAGVLICADNAGYFVPSTAQEAHEAIGRLRSQGREMVLRASRLETLASQMFDAWTPQRLEF